MTTLLEKLGVKKKELPKNQTILYDDDLVKLCPGGILLYLFEEKELYLVKGDFSEIDFLNPNPLVSLKHFGPIKESSRKGFQRYRKLRDSLNQQSQKHF